MSQPTPESNKRGDIRERSKSECASARFFSATNRRRPLPIAGLEPGRTIGDYRLVEMIDQGGMGQVWEAVQLSLGNRRVAIKFVRPERVSATQLDYFRREARAGGRLCHPGIVAVYSYGEEGSLAWIGMEYVAGDCSLRDAIEHMASETSLPANYFAEVSVLVAKIAEAMQAAHTAGVIHRDLKPQNVLITPDDQPKVTDFGLARILDESAVSDTGEFAGTYYYMSPEQVAAKRAGLDHRTDIFSLGAILYELLTLRRPFDGDSPLEISNKILFEEPPDPQLVRPDVPRSLADVCLQALEKRPDNRFQSMSEMASALSSYGGQSIRPSAHQDLSAKNRAPFYIWLSVGAVAILLLARQVSIHARGAKNLPTAEAESTLPERADLDRPPTIAERVEALLTGGLPYEALLLARSAQVTNPSPQVEEAVALASRAALKELGGFVQSVSPTRDGIIAANPVIVRGAVRHLPSSESITINGRAASFVNLEFECSLGNLEDGVHELELLIGHTIGLSIPFPLRFIVDTEAPSLTLDQPQEGQLVPANFVVMGTLHDATVDTLRVGSEVVRVDESGRWKAELTLPAGPAKIVAVANDALNRSTSSAIHVLVDAEPPVIQDPGNGFSTTLKPEDTLLRLIVFDDHGIGEVSWDGRPVHLHDSGALDLVVAASTIEDVPSRHVLIVADVVGNTTVQEVDIARDGTPPQIELEGRLDGVFAKSTEFFVRGRIQDRSTCILSLNGVRTEDALVGDFALPVIVPDSVEPGDSFPIIVVAVDAAGNEFKLEYATPVLNPCIRCKAIDGERGKCSHCDAGIRRPTCPECDHGVLRPPCPDCSAKGRLGCTSCDGVGTIRGSACLKCTNGKLPCIR